MCVYVRESVCKYVGANVRAHMHSCLRAYVHTCVCKLKLDEEACLRASSQALVKCLLVIVEEIMLYTYNVRESYNMYTHLKTTVN